jgi:hypothetical protein
MDAAETDIDALQALSSLVDSLSVSLGSLSSSYASLSSVQSTVIADVNALSSNVNSLAASLAGKLDSAASLNLINNALTSYATLNEVNAIVNAGATKIYRCVNGGVVSKEKFLLIDGNLYGVMNYVTKQTLNYTNTSTNSTTITVPSYCSGNSKDKLARSASSCNNSEIFVPAQNVVVAPSTSASISVVTGVEMALEHISVGSYRTTDGGVSCTFSANANGTYTNLEAI